MFLGGIIAIPAMTLAEQAIRLTIKDDNYKENKECQLTIAIYSNNQETKAVNTAGAAGITSPE